MDQINVSTCHHPEFHAVVTVKLGELIEGGFVNWQDPSWKWNAYDDEQYQRVCEKFNARFYWSEIGILPPGRWKQQVIRMFNEIMPKYSLLYNQLEQGVDPLAEWDEYGKSRDIVSEFPQTMLSGNEDYASRGNDREFETIHQGAYLDQALKLQTRYNDVDVMILDEMEEFFTCLATVNMNGR